MPAAPPPLIAALLDPRRYSHTPDRVELVETHASWVLLAGDFAYKIKKAITLPFLDYGTLARREAFCRAELVLNRRLAPELYLDVIPIGGSPGQPRLGELPAIEWAVRMRRFDESRRLDHLAARGELEAGHLSQLAATLGDFQQAAAIATSDMNHGSPERVLAAARENFIELRQLLPADEQASVEMLAAHDNSNSAPEGGIHTREATSRTYARLLALARELLHAGWPVIVDAAFLKRAERASFAALAAELGVGFRILATDVPPEELRRRLLARSGDASEATVAVLEKQLEWCEPLSENERACTDTVRGFGNPSVFSSTSAPVPSCAAGCSGCRRRG